MSVGKATTISCPGRTIVAKLSPMESAMAKVQKALGQAEAPHEQLEETSWKVKKKKADVKKQVAVAEETAKYKTRVKVLANALKKRQVSLQQRRKKAKEQRRKVTCCHEHTARSHADDVQYCSILTILKSMIENNNVCI